jgi:Tol biopolymer transport system component
MRVSRDGLLLRWAALVAAAALAPTCSEDVGEGDTPPEVNVIASLRADGGAANDESYAPSISGQGRHVVFESKATNLTPGDIRGWQDIFLKDRATSAVENISEVPEVGIFPQKNHDAFEPFVSASGRFVAFTSRGVQVGGPLPASVQTKRNAYVLDRSNGTLRRVINLPDPWPDEDIDNPVVSDDGRWVAFSTWASNLSIPNAPKFFQIYLADLSASPPSLTLVSHGTASPATLGNQDSFFPSLSPDGEWVAFESTSSNLHANDSDMSSDIFLWRRSTGFVELVSRNTAGTKGDAQSFKPALSADGQAVAFHTFSGNFYPIPPVTQSIAHRRRTGIDAGTTTMVTEDPGLPFPAIFAADPISISADGQLVAFSSDNQAITPVPLNNLRQIFVRDMQGGTRLASQGFFGAAADRECLRPAISGDGRWVAWQSQASNLMANDTGGLMNIFVRGPLR